MWPLLRVMPRYTWHMVYNVYDSDVIVANLQIRLAIHKIYLSMVYLIVAASLVIQH